MRSPADRSTGPSRERGAAAVEFALVLPILLLFLFGIIQYGYGLLQLQAFNSALSDASRVAATGVPDCQYLRNSWGRLTSGNLLDDGSREIHLQWVDTSGAVLPRPERAELARVTATYHPFRIGLPGVPFPSSVTRSIEVPVQDIGDTALGAC